MTTDPVALELAHRMPWTVAEDNSWWLITGLCGKHWIENQLAQKITESLTVDTDGPLFAVFGWHGQVMNVPPSCISYARRVVIAYADDIATAITPDQQDLLDAALARRDEETQT